MSYSRYDLQEKPVLRIPPTCGSRLEWLKKIILCMELDCGRNVHFFFFFPSKGKQISSAFDRFFIFEMVFKLFLIVLYFFRDFFIILNIIQNF